MLLQKTEHLLEEIKSQFCPKQIEPHRIFLFPQANVNINTYVSKPTVSGPRGTWNIYHSFREMGMDKSFI